MAKTDYHFSFGDSNDGSLGMCAVVRADSGADAVKILQHQCAEMEDEYAVLPQDEDRDVQYMRVYFNHRNISERDIDDENEVEAEEEADDVITVPE